MGYNIPYMEFLGNSEWNFIARLTVAVILGLIVGAERSHVGKSAGMRTYALVSLGAALFIIISEEISASYLGSGLFSKTSLDPTRIASQLVVGIGFLGAGVIFVQRKILTGLTTAAGLWVVAGIGAACGYGLYSIAVYATFLTLFIFEVLWYVEERFVHTAGGDKETRLFMHQEEESSIHHADED